MSIRVYKFCEEAAASVHCVILLGLIIVHTGGDFIIDISREIDVGSQFSNLIQMQIYYSFEANDQWLR